MANPLDSRLRGNDGLGRPIDVAQGQQHVANPQRSRANLAEDAGWRDDAERGTAFALSDCGQLRRQCGAHPSTACESLVLTVVEINSLDELAVYRGTWHALWLRTFGATFFHTYDWLEVYWRHYGQSQRLRVLDVRRGGETIGLLPLCVTPEATRLGTVRTLTYPLSDWGVDYGPLGDEPAATLAAGLAHVRRTPRDWDLLDLRWIDAAAIDDATAAYAAAELSATLAVWVETAHVDLRCGWDDYWASRKSHWRTNVRRCEKRLAERDLAYVRYRPRGQAAGDDDPRWDLYAACEDVARRSWQADSTTGTTLTHPEVRPFLRDAHAAAARAGAVDVNLLYRDDVPVAFAYNYVWRGEVFGLRNGFDASAQRDGVGTVLMLRAIQDSAARRDTLYDLGPGYLDCKRAWWTSLQPKYRLTHYPRANTRAQLLRLKRWAQRSLHLFPRTPLARAPLARAAQLS